MYIALYDENRNHITNVDNATYDLTTRVYDNDSFSGEGVCAEDVNDAKIAVVNDDAGNYKYACFADTITPEYNKRTIKGLDFKTLWDTEILLDYTPHNSFNGKLSAIFEKVRAAVFDVADAAVGKIPVEVVIPTDNTDTTDVYGDLQGTYQLVNAYTFLKGYLKYYEYNIKTRYDIAAGKIIFTFVKCTTVLTVDLSDFIHELTTTSSATNKTVATIKYDVETPETDADGNTIIRTCRKWTTRATPLLTTRVTPYISRNTSRARPRLQQSITTATRITTLCSRTRRAIFRGGFTPSKQNGLSRNILPTHSLTPCMNLPTRGTSIIS